MQLCAFFLWSTSNVELHYYINGVLQETEELYLVMELVPGGDLFDAISQANQFSEEQAADLMTDLGQALAYLHNEQRVVHR